jgi:hypothetical protein
MGSRDESKYYHTVSYFADGVPVPDLLTEEEAVKFLRLDIDGPKDPSATLKHYRDKKLLRGTRIGRKYRYSRLELLKFIELATIQTDKTSENL